MTRNEWETWVRERADECFRLCGEVAFEEALEQAGVPKTFSWSSLSVSRLRALSVAFHVRILEVKG